MVVIKIPTIEDDNPRVEGTVSHVLSEREIVIDRGQIDGVEIGNRFVVLGITEMPNERFPEKTLTIDYPKTIVKIVRFMGDDHAVGRTFRTVKGRPGRDTLASAVSYIEQIRATPDHVETLDLEIGAALLSKQAPGGKTIRIGDIVRQTRGDEYLEDFV